MILKSFTALGFYAFVCIGVNASVIGPALPALAQRTGAPLDQVGLLFTPFALGYATSVFIMGPIGSRFGTRALLLAGATGLLASFALLLGGRSLPVIFLGAYLLGLGQSGTQVGYNAAFGLMAGKDAARALNRLNAFFGIGALAGPLVVALGYSQFGTADLALWMALLMNVPLWIGALAWRNPAGAGARGRDGAAPIASLRAALRQPILWLLGATTSLYVSGEVTFSGWAAVYVERGAGVSAAQSALVVTLFFAGFTVSRYVADALMRRVRLSRMVSGSIALAAAGVVLMLAVPGLFAASAAGSLIVGYAMGPIYPILIAYGIRLFPDTATAVTGWLTSVAAVAALFVPSIAGIVMTSQGVAAAWGVLLAILAALAALWMLLSRQLAGGHQRL